MWVQTFRRKCILLNAYIEKPSLCVNQFKKLEKNRIKPKKNRRKLIIRKQKNRKCGMDY